MGEDSLLPNIKKVVYILKTYSYMNYIYFCFDQLVYIFFNMYTIFFIMFGNIESSPINIFFSDVR